MRTSVASIGHQGMSSIVCSCMNWISTYSRCHSRSCPKMTTSKESLKPDGTTSCSTELLYPPQTLPCLLWSHLQSQSLFKTQLLDVQLNRFSRLKDSPTTAYLVLVFSTQQMFADCCVVAGDLLFRLWWFGHRSRVHISGKLGFYQGIQFCGVTYLKRSMYINHDTEHDWLAHPMSIGRTSVH